MNKLIVKKLIVTEKGTRLKEGNQFVFEVDRGANKVEIRREVERRFQVKVVDVNTMMRRGKAKRMRTAAYGHTSDWKRAVVTLQAGQTIEMA